MKPLIAVLAALLLAGCSKTSQNISGNAASSSSASAQPTGGQVRPASENPEVASTMDWVGGKKWQQTDRMDEMSGVKKEVEFDFWSQPVGDTPKGDAPIFLLACDKNQLTIGAKTGMAESGNVRLKFGDGPIEKQNWLYIKGHDSMWARQPKPLLKQILSVESFKFEYTPPERAAQVFEVRTLNLKELMDKEPLCK